MGPNTGIGAIAGTKLGVRECHFESRDLALYALAVGAHATDLDLVYEDRIRALPTFALTLGLWAVWAAGNLGAYDSTKTLHVGQELTLHGPLPTTGRLETGAHIGNVWDKGRAALIEVIVAAEEFTTTYMIFVPGAGGFGGGRGPTGTDHGEVMGPELKAVFQTQPDQAALYRLTGDLHPVHIDPAAAAAVGFGRPILHGLCTLGGSTLQLARAASIDPTLLTGLTARFSAPVTPGDAVNIRAIRAATGFSYQAAVGDTTVLTGTATFA